MSVLNGHAASGRSVHLSSSRANLVTALDIGTSKICCFVAKLRPDSRLRDLPGRSHAVEVLGIGHQLSRGIKGGVVVDMDAAEACIRDAVDAAEQMAGLRTEQLLVNLSCGRLNSEAFSANVAISGRTVDAQDIQRLLRAGRDHSRHDRRSIVHAVPIAFSLDGSRGIKDPRGMVGDDLGVDIHIVSGELAPLRNLSLLISRAHLSASAMVVTPYASGLSCLVPDELQLGALCIDMGGGTTSLSIFHEGQFVYADVVAIGGSHVTTDIARGLSTPVVEAERIKTLYGSAMVSPSDEREIISVPPVSDRREVPAQIPKSVLIGMIQPRLEEIFELLRDRVGSKGFARYAGRCAVLTGGASQLPGAREVASRILEKQVRIGRPLGIGGLPEPLGGPAFSAVSGLLVYPQIAGRELVDLPDAPVRTEASRGYFARVGNWLRESF